MVTHQKRVLPLKSSSFRSDQNREAGRQAGRQTGRRKQQAANLALCTEVICKNSRKACCSAVWRPGAIRDRDTGQLKVCREIWLRSR